MFVLFSDEQSIMSVVIIGLPAFVAFCYILLVVFVAFCYILLVVMISIFFMQSLNPYI